MIHHYCLFLSNFLILFIKIVDVIASILYFKFSDIIFYVDIAISYHCFNLFCQASKSALFVIDFIWIIKCPLHVFPIDMVLCFFWNISPVSMSPVIFLN
jgi:hypothetical protein